MYSIMNISTYVVFYCRSVLNTQYRYSILVRSLTGWLDPTSSYLVHAWCPSAMHRRRKWLAVRTTGCRVAAPAPNGRAREPAWRGCSKCSDRAQDRRLRSSCSAEPARAARAHAPQPPTFRPQPSARIMTRFASILFSLQYCRLWWSETHRTVNREHSR